MSFADTINRGQDFLEQTMLDACTITRATGEPVFDPTTGQYTDGETTVYTGKCRIKPQYAASETDAGEKEVVLRRYNVVLPWTTPRIDIDDVFAATVSADEWLIGVRLVVIAVEFATARTARHLTVRHQA